MSDPFTTIVFQTKRVSWIEKVLILVIFFVYFGIGLEIKRRWNPPPVQAGIKTVVIDSVTSVEPSNIAKK